MNNFDAEFYPEMDFGGFTDIDGTIAFYSRVNALLEPCFEVIDFGCGRGSHQDDLVSYRRDLRALKGKVRSLIGLDVDVNGALNRFVDTFRLLSSDRPWPVESDSVNLIVCDCVIEHLPDPILFFAEARRVLVKGGFVCIRTTNILSYIGLISLIVPNRHHKRLLAAAQPSRKTEDVFPTLYRCNTTRAIRKQFEAHGFRSAVYGYEAEPSYLNFSRAAYRIGVLHQSVAPRFVRPTIFAFAELM